MRDETLRELLGPHDRDDAIVLATDLTTGEEKLLRPFAAPIGSDPLVTAARDALVADRSTTVDTGAGRVFLHVFNPPVRVVIVGAGHIAQHLASMAATVGYDVAVVDPRTAFATAERFPSVRLLRSWPAEALAELGLDRRTAVVTVTHDPKIDDPALAAALGSEVFYIGALGSRRTHGARLGRLREAGHTEEELARIRAPVGLDIGARTPGEIATSVLAQIVQALRAAGA